LIISSAKPASVSPSRAAEHPTVRAHAIDRDDFSAEPGVAVRQPLVLDDGGDLVVGDEKVSDARLVPHVGWQDDRLGVDDAAGARLFRGLRASGIGMPVRRGGLERQRAQGYARGIVEPRAAACHERKHREGDTHGDMVRDRRRAWPSFASTQAREDQVHEQPGVDDGQQQRDHHQSEEPTVSAGGRPRVASRRSYRTRGSLEQRGCGEIFAIGIADGLTR
jgi:hypothetical protein